MIGIFLSNFSARSADINIFGVLVSFSMMHGGGINVSISVLREGIDTFTGVETDMGVWVSIFVIRGGVESQVGLGLGQLQSIAFSDEGGVPVLGVVVDFLVISRGVNVLSSLVIGFSRAGRGLGTESQVGLGLG
jgi:hypothetical protein